MLAEVEQFGTRRKRTTGELLDGLREKDLTTVTGREQPREPVEGSSQVVAAIVRVRLPRMDSHAHP